MATSTASSIAVCSVDDAPAQPGTEMSRGLRTSESTLSRAAGTAATTIPTPLTKRTVFRSLWLRGFFARFCAACSCDPTSISWARSTGSAASRRASPVSPVCLRICRLAAAPARTAAASRCRSFSSFASGSTYPTTASAASVTASVTVPTLSATAVLAPPFRPNMTYLHPFSLSPTSEPDAAAPNARSTKYPAKSGFRRAARCETGRLRRRRRFHARTCRSRRRPSPCRSADITALAVVVASHRVWSIARASGRRADERRYDDLQGAVLLRGRHDRGHGRSGGRRLLPLRQLQELVRRPGQRVHALAARGGRGHAGRRAHRRIPQQRAELPGVVQALRRPSADAAPAVEPRRCLRGDDSRLSVHRRSTRQLRVDRAADEGRPPEAQGLSRRARGLGRDAPRVVAADLAARLRTSPGRRVQSTPCEYRLSRRWRPGRRHARPSAPRRTCERGPGGQWRGPDAARVPGAYGGVVRDGCASRVVLGAGASCARGSADPSAAQGAARGGDRPRR